MSPISTPGRARTALLTVAAVLAAFMPLLGGTPSTAQAAGCSGALIEHRPIRGDRTGNLFGYLDVYYNSSTGRNCARTVSSARTWGVAKPMYVGLYKCSQTRRGGCTVVAKAEDKANFTYGSYAYYAGPRSLYAAGHCIAARGDIQFRGEHGAAFTPNYPGGSHCG
jgi:hypothetical protein